MLKCRCCGGGVVGKRAEIERCVLCDLCDGLHGYALQMHCTALVRSGQITMWQALARMALDDAHLARMLALVPCPTPDQANGVELWIPAPVPRWRVEVGRARALGELPDLGLIVQVIIARHIPGQATPGAIREIEEELRQALATLDPNIVSVRVSSRRDALDPQHLVIEIEGRAAELGAVTVPACAADVEIPSDIMVRPRGSA